MSKSLRPSVKFKLYKRVRKDLAKLYPHAFPGRGTRPPLEIGILKKMLADPEMTESATSLRLFLSIWTNSTSYLISVSRGRKRVSLDGTPVDGVEEKHASEAREIIRQRRDKRTAKTLT